MSSDLEKAGSYTPPDAWQGGTWAELTAGAHEVFGADLEKGDSLIGVPMCLVRATFRPGDITNLKTGVAGFYVSLDTIVADELTLNRAKRRGKIPHDNGGLVEPGEHLVFNEGGTGVYRQVVSYLESTGRIKIKSDLPETGAYGESRFDVLPESWDVDATADFRADDDGKPTVAFNIRLLCPRGLRSSEYENEYTKAGKTRYIG